MKYTEKQKADYKDLSSKELEVILSVLTRQNSQNGDSEAIMSILDERLDTEEK